MVLREGWDVQNVVAIVGLRPFTSNSKILPEQTLGRGLRRMFRDKPVQEKVSVIGTDAFMDFVESIKVEGVELEYQPMGDKGGAPMRPSMMDRDPSIRSSYVRKIGKPIVRARLASSQRRSADMETTNLPRGLLSPPQCCTTLRTVLIGSAWTSTAIPRTGTR